MMHQIISSTRKMSWTQTVRDIGAEEAWRLPNYGKNGRTKLLTCVFDVQIGRKKMANGFVTVIIKPSTVRAAF
jgi:hypothetical protein